MATRFAMAMIVCSDLQRSRDFYVNILSLKIGNESMPHWVDFNLGSGHQLGLHPATETLAAKPGAIQLGFFVDNVDAFIADAHVAGVRVLQEPFDERHARRAVIADPDGYPIQIATPKT